MKRLARVVWALAAVLALAALVLMLAQALVPALNTGAIDWFSIAIGILIYTAFPLITGLILFRQPQNMIGWLLLAPQVLLSAGVVANAALSPLATPPSPAPWPLLALLWGLGASWIPFIYSLLLIPVFFPTGRPPSPRWWWLVGALVVHGGLFVAASLFVDQFTAEGSAWSIPNPIGVISAAQFGVLLRPWQVGLAALVVLCLAALVVRYRRAGVVERAQLRWLLYACALFVLLYLPQLFIPLETPAGQPTPLGVLLNVGFGLTLLFIPASIAVAVLRYRLWDIDVIIRRTLVYSVLSLVLAAFYFGSVVVLQSLFQLLTGERNSALVTVLSTLMIAALFGPLRARVQQAIDRRFYRQKYDAARTLAAFGAQARDVVALEQLSDDLTQAVDDTMRPAHVGLWVRQPDKPVR